MDSKKCDRCGTFYQPEDWEHGDIVIKNKRKEYSVLSKDIFFVDEDIDLCPGCTSYIKDWLTKKEN